MEEIKNWLNEHNIDFNEHVIGEGTKVVGFLYGGLIGGNLVLIERQEQDPYLYRILMPQIEEDVNEEKDLYRVLDIINKLNQTKKLMKLVYSESERRVDIEAWFFLPGPPINYVLNRILRLLLQIKTLYGIERASRNMASVITDSLFPNLK